jgi:hypothetical protein
LKPGDYSQCSPDQLLKYLAMLDISQLDKVKIQFQPVHFIRKFLPLIEAEINEGSH